MFSLWYLLCFMYSSTVCGVQLLSVCEPFTKPIHCQLCKLYVCALTLHHSQQQPCVSGYKQGGNV